MRNHINDFAQHVRSAPTNKQSEKVVRLMIEEVAKDCPMGVLLCLGQCLIDYRKSELRDEAERN